MGVDKMGVDQMRVDEMGVDEMGTHPMLLRRTPRCSWKVSAAGLPWLEHFRYT